MKTIKSLILTLSVFYLPSCSLGIEINEYLACQKSDGKDILTASKLIPSKIDQLTGDFLQHFFEKKCLLRSEYKEAYDVLDVILNEIKYAYLLKHSSQQACVIKILDTDSNLDFFWLPNGVVCLEKKTLLKCKNVDELAGIIAQLFCSIQKCSFLYNYPLNFCHSLYGKLISWTRAYTLEYAPKQALIHASIFQSTKLGLNVLSQYLQKDTDLSAVELLKNTNFTPYALVTYLDRQLPPEESLGDIIYDWYELNDFSVEKLDTNSEEEAYKNISLAKSVEIELRENHKIRAYKTAIPKCYKMLLTKFVDYKTRINYILNYIDEHNIPRPKKSSAIDFNKFKESLNETIAV